MPLLARLANRASLVLHQLVYSFPSAHGPPAPAAQPTIPTVGGVHVQPTEPPGVIAARPAAAAAAHGEGQAIAAGLGPLSFAGSGYGVALLVMAILLNRIQHIVRRPRDLPPRTGTGPHASATLLRRGRAAISDILADPDTPHYLRLPGILALSRAWVLFSVLLLHSSGLWPDLEHGESVPVWRTLVGRVGRWAGEMEMETVCWQVFLSVCAGLVCSGIANGLDPVRRRDAGAGFNLFGYSFLLHLYSSPLTHNHPNGESSHGRPDKHALFQLWLSLTELTWLQAIELSRTLRNNILLPTAVCGSMGIIHFACVLIKSPLLFPSFTFLTHVVSPGWYLLALFLSIVIACTMVLKAITLLFTIGSIPSLASLLPHDGVVPNVEDDFGVTLLKIGTACIEATSFSGLRNELAKVDEPKAPWIEINADVSEFHGGMLQGLAFPGFSTEITRIQVAENEVIDAENKYWKELRSFLRACLITVVAGFLMAVLSTRAGRKVIKLGKRTWRMRWWYGPRGWRFWRRDAWREPVAMRHMRILGARLDEATELRDELKRQIDSARRTVGTVGRSSAVDTRRGRESSLPIRRARDAERREVWTYGDYLLNDVQGDAEDDDEWVGDTDDQSDAGSMSVASSQYGDDSDGDETEVEEDRKGEMYRDLIVTELEDEPSSGMDLQPVLLAHLTSRTTTPLTRRRYASLITHSSSSQSPGSRLSHEGAVELRDVIRGRREAMADKKVDDDDETKRTCVVCMVSMRDTILWPCRCLALCNDCRENLAARLPSHDHMCPCCRQKVDGYSRIFIP